MDYPPTRNKDLVLRAIELMQCLLSPGEPPRFSGDLFPEYPYSKFSHDLQTCDKDEQTILESNARALIETTIRRKMPTLWLIKTRHPIFVIYAALCTWIDKSINTAFLFLGDTDFLKMTEFGTKLVRAPLQIIEIEDHTSLSTALENLPTRKHPPTVLCNWRFDAWDSSVAEAYEMDGKASILRPE